MGIALYHQLQSETANLLDTTITDQINLADGTDTHIIKAQTETGLGGRLTLALDETARTLVVCDYGDVATDLGLVASANPRLVVFAADASNYISLTGLELDMNSHNIDNIKTATFIAEVTQSVSAGFTVDWTAAQKQNVTITGAPLVATFTAPDGPANLMLKVTQGDGDDTITWPATVKWPGGVAPTLSTTAADIDIVSFYYDGTSYFGVVNLDFSVPA